MAKKKQPPAKDIYYQGKAYTKEGFKRQLIKEGKIKVVRTPVYVNVDLGLDYSYYVDFEDMVEEMQDAYIWTPTELHFEDCETFNNYGSTHECKDCPYKEECKQKKL